MTQSKIPGWEVAERAVHRGMSWRCAIQIYVPMPNWKEAVELVPESARAETLEYLKGMAARARNVRDHKQEIGR